MSRRRLITAAAAAAVASLAPAGAARALAPAQPPTRVPGLFVATADLYGIPPAILYAIACQESGRAAPGLPLQPWPWTLNVAGRGYYYASHTEVWDGLSRHVERRPANVGVGLMQVTWPYNLHVLTDLYLVIEPQENLRVAAHILAERQRAAGDWWTAVGWYHSRTPALAARYRASVRRHWRRLQEDA
jgi:hypothetical protein